MMRNGGWKTALLEGWTLNGNLSAASGTPLTAYVSGNLSNTGGLAAFGNSRAEATGLPVEGAQRVFFNPAAFTIPAAGEFGDAGRDTIPGSVPSFSELLVQPGVPLRRVSRQLQLRVNANNALNHVMITSIGTTVNAANYGLPTGASGTRTVSLLLRFNF